MKFHHLLVAASQQGASALTTTFLFMTCALFVATVVPVSSQDPPFLYTQKFVVRYSEGELTLDEGDGLVSSWPIVALIKIEFRCDFGGAPGEITTELSGYDAEPSPTFSKGTNKRGNDACCACSNVCEDASCSVAPLFSCCSYPCPSDTTNITSTFSPTAASVAPTSTPIFTIYYTMPPIVFAPIEPTHSPVTPTRVPVTHRPPVTPTRVPVTRPTPPPFAPSSAPAAPSSAPAAPAKPAELPLKGKRATKAPFKRPSKKIKPHRKLQATPTLPPIFLLTNRTVLGEASFFEIQVSRDAGIFYVRTNEEPSTIAIDGSFNVSCTCSSNANITLVPIAIAPSYNTFGTTFGPNTTVTKTKSGSLCCPASVCSFCVSCKFSTGRCCGKTCPF